MTKNLGRKRCWKDDFTETLYLKAGSQYDARPCVALRCVTVRYHSVSSFVHKLTHAAAMSSSEDEEETFLLLSLLHRRRRHRKKKRKRKTWVRPIFAQRLRQGEYHNLLQELRLSDREYHFRYMRMSKETFNTLLSLVGPRLSRRRYFSTRRPEISPAERLAATLRYLATGNSQMSISFGFRIGRSTVCNMVRETCDAIWNALQPLYVCAPSNEQEWEGLGKQFYRQWNFPNCIGAMDGKHIVIQAPGNAGSMFFNYKGTHSIVLLAVCDAHYRFILVDIGDYGRHSDGGVLSSSSFGKALEEGKFTFPPDCSLPGNTDPIKLPDVFVADEAFPLKTNMLRPYPGRNLPEERVIFNYRLSRARRTIENSFGILAARWRIFRRPVIAQPDNVIAYTKATVALHNYLRTKESSVYCPPGFIDCEDGDGNVISGNWRTEVNSTSTSGLTPLGRTGANRYSTSAAAIRDLYCSYFNSHCGEVSWQVNHVRRTN